jgi:hypothetical protein
MKVYYQTQFGQEVSDCQTTYEVIVLVEQLIKKALDESNKQNCDIIIINPNEGERITDGILR